MSELLEQQLRQRLREVGDEVPAELEPPADLELRVKRFRHRRANQRRSKLLAAAAILVIAVAVVSVMARTRTRQTVQVAGEKVSRVGVLRPNVAMLDARGRYVVALDARGHQLATYVVTRAGSEIVDVQVTRDHQTLWYLSRDEHRTGCGRVVRADIGTGASRIVMRASEFAISRDGRQLAFTGCESGRPTKVLDVATGAVAPQTPVPVLDAESYVVRGPSIQQLGASGTPLRTVARVGSEWSLEQVVPTRAGVFVFGRHAHDPSALYRVVNGRLAHVRTYDYGHLTGVLARR
jgi:hypothetical protein